jgi:hypothetical protein
VDDFFVGLAAVGEPAPRAAVGVEIRSLPVAGQVRVRVPERLAGELLGRRKPVNWREQVRSCDGKEKCRKNASEDEQRD